jgi:hypothetical protein
MSEQPYQQDEVAYWRSRAETAEQRLKEAANFYPDVPPEPPVGTVYTNVNGGVAWTRHEDGWHCGRKGMCLSCPCEWTEAWDLSIRDPRFIRTLPDVEVRRG